MNMNNVGDMRGTYGRREAAGYRAGRSGKAETAPAWLVMICRAILWLMRDDVKDMIRTLFAICAVMALAVVAGAMDFGAIPFAHGAVICIALGAAALFATRDE